MSFVCPKPIKFTSEKVFLRRKNNLEIHQIFFQTWLWTGCIKNSNPRVQSPPPRGCTWRPCRQAGTSRWRPPGWRGQTTGWTGRSRRRVMRLRRNKRDRPARWGTEWRCGLKRHKVVNTEGWQGTAEVKLRILAAVQAINPLLPGWSVWVNLTLKVNQKIFPFINFYFIESQISLKGISKRFAQPKRHQLIPAEQQEATSGEKPQADPNYEGGHQLWPVGVKRKTQNWKDRDRSRVKWQTTAYTFSIDNESFFHFFFISHFFQSSLSGFN